MPLMVLVLGGVQVIVVAVVLWKDVLRQRVRNISREIAVKGLIASSIMTIIQLKARMRIGFVLLALQASGLRKIRLIVSQIKIVRQDHGASVSTAARQAVVAQAVWKVSFAMQVGAGTM